MQLKVYFYDKLWLSFLLFNCNPVTRTRVTYAGKSGKRPRSLTIASWQIKVPKVREKNYNHINTMKDNNNNYQY